MDNLAEQEVAILRQVETYRFPIPIADDDEIGLKDFVQEILLPHEVFAALFEHHRDFFRRTFAVNKLEEWWGHQDATRRDEHPLFNDADAATTIPIQIYGDNVSVCKTVSCLVMLFKGCCAFRLPAHESLLPISSTPLKGTDRYSLEPIFQVLVWSLAVMAAGVWPAADHLDRPWPEGGRRAKLGAEGARLAGPFRGIFWESVGDWEWIAETFAFNVWGCYYLTRDICHRCMAAIRGPYDYKNLSYEAACFSVKRLLADYMAAVVPPSAFATVPGFSLELSILWDWMHVSPLGVQHKSCGACLHELVQEGKWGVFRGEWKIRVAIPLKRAFKEFKTWCRDVAGLEHSQQKTTPKSLTLVDTDSVPALKGKAHNLMCVSKWLAHLTHSDNSTVHRRNRSRVMWAISALDTLFSSAGEFLSDDEAGQVDLARSVLFPAWRALRTESQDERWPIIPKHHAMMHMCQDAVVNRRNPAGFWCFAGEHMMGESKGSLGGQYQVHLERRMLRAALLRLGFACG